MDLRFVIFSCFACILLAKSSDAEASIQQCSNSKENMNLLCLLDIDETSSWLGLTKKQIYCPATGLNHDPIACIQVIDVSKDNAGHAVIQNGGIGYNFVEIVLTSKFYEGLKYHVEVYTVPKLALRQMKEKANNTNNDNIVFIDDDI